MYATNPAAAAAVHNFLDGGLGFIHPAIAAAWKEWMDYAPPAVSVWQLYNCRTAADVRNVVAEVARAEGQRTADIAAAARAAAVIAPAHVAASAARASATAAHCARRALQASATAVSTSSVYLLLEVANAAIRYCNMARRAARRAGACGGL